MPRSTLQSEYQRGYDDGVAAGIALGRGTMIRDRQAIQGAGTTPVVVLSIGATPPSILPVIVQDSRYD